MQSPEGHAAKQSDPAEAMRRRLENLESNVNDLGSKVKQTLQAFEDAEQNKLRRQMALNALIRTIAEVRFITDNDHDE